MLEWGTLFVCLLEFAPHALGLDSCRGGLGSVLTHGQLLHVVPSLSLQPLLFIFACLITIKAKGQKTNLKNEKC